MRSTLFGSSLVHRVVATLAVSSLLMGAVRYDARDSLGSSSSSPGTLNVTSFPGSCLDAVMQFDVNGSTQSVSLDYAVIDPATGDAKSGILGYEVRNVLPGSTGHAYGGTGLDEGDLIVFRHRAYSGQNGTGTEVGEPKLSQVTGACP